MTARAFALLAPVVALAACAAQGDRTDASAVGLLDPDAAVAPDPVPPDLGAADSAPAPGDLAHPPDDLALIPADLSMVAAPPDLASTCVAKTPTTYLSEIFCTTGKQNLCLSDHPPNGF